MGETLQTMAPNELAILANDACRDALTNLSEQADGATSLAALASDCGGDGVVGTDDASIRLHHVTLPRLDDAGLVDYDAEGQTVRYLAGTETERWLDRIGDRR